MTRLWASLAAALMVVTPSVANAAIEITPTAPSGTFKNDSVVCTSGTIECMFTDTITFLTPAGYNQVGATITTGPAQTADQDILFGTSTISDPVTVLLNGTAFVLNVTGATEFATLSPIALIPGALNTLTVTGTVGRSGAGSYAGTLTFSQIPAVPEPATWLMLILGFGMLGGVMRRKKAAALPGWVAVA